MRKRELPYGHQRQHGHARRTRRSAAAGEETGTGFHQLFQGGRVDSAAGLYDFRTRDFSPTLRRWVQNEPLAYVDGLNVYDVPPDHPIVRVDPRST